jgi:hypothetical protein
MTNQRSRSNLNMPHNHLVATENSRLQRDSIQASTRLCLYVRCCTNPTPAQRPRIESRTAVPREKYNNWKIIPLTSLIFFYSSLPHRRDNGALRDSAPLRIRDDDDAPSSAPPRPTGTRAYTLPLFSHLLAAEVACGPYSGRGSARPT